MKFICSELQGALYQPQEALEIENCWIIPACKHSPVLTPPDEKLIFAYKEEDKPGKGVFIEYIFVHSHQFLFGQYSHIYWKYSERLLNNVQPFILDGTDVTDIEKQVRIKYGPQNIKFSKDYQNLESQYCTLLPIQIEFEAFFTKFLKLFTKDAKFKEIITLYCETINGIKILYDNSLQKIAQLQIIVDALLGQPKQVLCKQCMRCHNELEWPDFLDKKLNKYDLSDGEKDLIIRMRTALNQPRARFVHHASYYNPFEPLNLVKDWENLSEANSGIEQILEKNPIDWLGTNWMNAYQFYLIAVRNLIFLEYFQVSND
jgi:hypothetical protein